LAQHLKSHADNGITFGGKIIIWGTIIADQSSALLQKKPTLFVKKYG